MSASAGDLTIDEQLIARLDALIVAETAPASCSCFICSQRRGSSSRTPTARHEHDLSMSNLAESLANVTLGSDIAKTLPKKGKKKYPMTAPRRKTGYQRFTSCFFQKVADCFARAYPDESPPHSTAIFCELAIQWRALTPEQRDQWNCYAKSRAPKPTLDLIFFSGEEYEPTEDKKVSGEYDVEMGPDLRVRGLVLRTKRVQPMARS